MLKSYENPALDKKREVFQLNLTLFPNWVSHLLIVGSMFVSPLLIAEQILLISLPAATSRLNLGISAPGNNDFETVDYVRKDHFFKQPMNITKRAPS